MNYPIGSISSGTMRTEDLITAFSAELEWLAKQNDETTPDVVGEANALEDYDSEDAEWILEALLEALNEFAAPYFYFGAHPGDGADYGFWLIDDVAQQVKDNGGLVVDDTGDVPADFTGEVLHVNDHGNCTLYNAQSGELTEIWGVV